MADEQLDRAITNLSVLTLRKLDIKEMHLYSKEVGIDLKKEFTIDKKFLENHTKDQLKDLATELKNTLFKNGKKEECISSFTDSGFDLNVTPKAVISALKR